MNCFTANLIQSLPQLNLTALPHTICWFENVSLCFFFSFENKLPVGFGNIFELSSETLQSFQSSVCKIILFLLGNFHEQMFSCYFVLLIEIQKLLSHNCSEHM